MIVPLDALKQTALAILRQSGYPAEEAEIILDVLLYARLRGNNQGIVKLIPPGLPRDPDCQPIQTLRETKVSTLLDGGRNAGMVVMKQATDLAIQKAGAHGIGLVGTRGTHTSTGAIGYYARQVAVAGFIGLVFSGSGEYVAMHGSYQPLFGTNPLAVGFPIPGAPVVFDMATAAIARYGVVEARTAGRSIPPDVAYDDAGQPTTDPAAALRGAIRAFGGHKGAGLAFMVEALTGPLVGVRRTPDDRKADWGNLVLAVDPELLAGREDFSAGMSALVRRVKAASRLPGVEAVLIPGERGDQLMREALNAGALDVEDRLWEALQKQAS